MNFIKTNTRIIKKREKVTTDWIINRNIQLVGLISVILIITLNNLKTLIKMQRLSYLIKN